MDVDVKFDKWTAKWFRVRPGIEITLCQCEKCGLFYKPVLGHLCEKGRKEAAQNG